MRDDYAAPPPPAGGSGGPSIAFTGRSAAPAPSMVQGSRGRGYSNLGLQLPAGGGGINGDDQEEEDDEELAVGGLVAATAVRGGRRRKKMSYVGLDGDGVDDTPSQSSDGGDGGGDAEADRVSRRLAIFGLLNLGYVGLQLAGAMAFGSLALMSDGFHNLSDVAAIGMAMYIHHLQRKKCPENSAAGTDELPFGYKRAEVIGGLMNSVALVSLSAYIILSAIPRLFVPAEVTDGLPYIFLAFGGVLVNLVGVLFFLYCGEDTHGPHGGGFLTAHSHSHDHGHETPVELDSMGLLTLVDPYDVPVKEALSSFAGGGGGDGDDDEEISVVLAGPDPIGRVSLANTTAAREAALLSSARRNGGGVIIAGDEGEEDEHRGAWVGGGGGEGAGRHASSCSRSRGGRPHGHGHGHEEPGCCDGGEGHGHGHSHVEEGLSVSRHSGGTEPCSTSSSGSGGGCGHSVGAGHSHDHDHGHDHGHVHGHRHANGHACSNGSAGGKDGVEMTEKINVEGKHGTAAVCGGGGGGGESHGHHGGHSGGGGGCSHAHGHAHGGGHGARAGAGGGGCSGHGHGGGSMNLMAVLVHAIADAVSSGVVCAQGVVAFIFGKPGVDWTDYLDPLTSIALSVFIVYCALPVIKECSHVLLEGTPRGADLPRLRKELLKVRGVSSIESLSVTQLNSEEPFVAAVTVVAAHSGSDSISRTEEHGETDRFGREPKAERSRLAVGDWANAAAAPAAVVESVRRVLAGHNIGRNTVEIVSPPAAAPPAAVAAGGGDPGYSWAGGVDGVTANGNAGWVGDGGQIPSASGRDSGGGGGGAAEDEEVPPGGDGAGRSGGNSHGGHSHGHGHGHGQCSGHGHAHGHASTVDLV